MSVHKATAAGGGLTLGLMGLLSVISPLIGADPFMWTSFDIMFPSSHSSAPDNRQPSKVQGNPNKSEKKYRAEVHVKG